MTCIKKKRKEKRWRRWLKHTRHKRKANTRDKRQSTQKTPSRDFWASRDALSPCLHSEPLPYLLVKRIEKRHKQADYIYMKSNFLNEDINNRHANMDAGRVSHQVSTYTKSYRQPRHAEGRRNGLPQGRAHQLDIQYQMILVVKTYVQILWYRQQVVVTDLGMYVCVRQQLMRKEAVDWKRERRVVWEGLERGMGREK